jgi:hypothetical protein
MTDERPVRHAQLTLRVGVDIPTLQINTAFATDEDVLVIEARLLKALYQFYSSDFIILFSGLTDDITVVHWSIPAHGVTQDVILQFWDRMFNSAVLGKVYP